MLVLDLDETLVHSSFQPVDGADFTVRIRIEETWHTVYVTKRPGVDAFLERVSSQYEVVVFTASLRLVRAWCLLAGLFIVCVFVHMKLFHPTRAPTDHHTFVRTPNQYADPLLEILDKKRVVRHRLYREDCTFTQVHTYTPLHA